MTDREMLELAAMSATPGPWVTGNVDPLLFGHKQFNGTEPIGFVYGPIFEEESEIGRKAIATSAYIAAANPATILAILECVGLLRDFVNMADEEIRPSKNFAAHCRAALQKLEAL